jgi:Peptidase A4 family
MTCAGSSTYEAFWAGLDGYSSASTEQAGTEADCSGGTPVYFAWYDLYPAAPVDLSKSVKPGDSMTATVSATTKDVFTITIHNATEGWNFTTHGGTLGASDPTLITSSGVTCGSITDGGTEFSCSW